MHVYVCICMYHRFSICMYLKNYVFASLFKFQLHVCACIKLFLLEIRLKRRGITGMDRSYSNSSTKQSRYCFKRTQQDSHWHLAILCPTCSCSTAGCQTPPSRASGLLSRLWHTPLTWRKYSGSLTPQLHLFSAIYDHLTWYYRQPEIQADTTWYALNTYRYMPYCAHTYTYSHFTLSQFSVIYQYIQTSGTPILGNFVVYTWYIPGLWPSLS